MRPRDYWTTPSGFDYIGDIFVDGKILYTISVTSTVIDISISKDTEHYTECGKIMYIKFQNKSMLKMKILRIVTGSRRLSVMAQHVIFVVVIKNKNALFTHY